MKNIELSKDEQAIFETSLKMAIYNQLKEKGYITDEEIGILIGRLCAL